ncbi:MAG: alpha-amylase family glycosyl hydrolase [Acholeplasmataceae bacterium]
MAKQTNLDLRNQVIYQVYPRQYSNEGTFEALRKDLDRIVDLGVSILYLLPIHPIGHVGRKGVDGCPYSISDYYGIAEELGTMDDFDRLVKDAHEKGLKVMLDIVFNHTSRDSKLTKEHPEWFYKNDDGGFANRIGDWSDVTDLTYDDPKQWTYLTDNLVFWAKKVDGFRCDVAPLVPLEFWQEAREAVEKVSEGHVWLTESVHPHFIQYIRSLGHDAHSDGEMYQVFDIGYDYDIDDFYEGYLKGEVSFSSYIEAIEKQDFMYPKNYIKLRAFENHDKSRLSAKVKDEDMFKNMLAMSFFFKGIPMLYNGVEVMSTKHLTLFDKDPINWHEHEDITSFLKQLIALKKHPLNRDGNFKVHYKDGGAVLSYELNQQKMVGLFNVEGTLLQNIPLEPGTYKNALTNQEITISSSYQGKEPVWIIV